MRPWRQRSQRRSKRVKRQPRPHPKLPVPVELEEGTTSLVSLDDEHKNNPFRQGFPNFQNRLAPIGGYSPKVGRIGGDDHVDGDASNKEAELKIPESSYTRPSLKNIFPMLDTAATKPQTTSPLTAPPVTTPPVTTPPVTTPPKKL